MSRFSSIIYGCLFVVATLAAASAQATHPMPMNGPMPNANQQVQPNARGTMQQVPPQQMNQQSPPGSPAPNPAQQIGQQPVTRPADPAPTAPTSPPVVTYRDGMLTVQAMNSTLSSVLAAIKSKTGIEFEGLENVQQERVVISQGPAPSGDVLSAIFAGAKFDFIAIGRPDSPEIVQRVILSPKKGSEAAVASQQAHPKQNSGQEGDDDDTPDETVNAGDPQDTPIQPPPTQAQQQPDQQPQAQPKSPEQLLQELQEMRKQQEQQQQGVTPNPAQVPRKQPPLN